MISILLDTADYLVIDKPSGLSVHNAKPDEESVLTVLRGQGFANLNPVHRLDQEASGILLLAKNHKATERASKQFQDRQVQKIYRAILRGSLPENEEIIWSDSLSDAAQGYRDPQGKARPQLNAETRVKVLRSNSYFSDVEIDLITGRTHQIRRHAALAGHHLLGDTRYTRPGYQEKMAKLYGFQRMFLHACRLEIPALGIRIESEAPEDFEKIFAPATPVP